MHAPHTCVDGKVVCSVDGVVVSCVEGSVKAARAECEGAWHWVLRWPQHIGICPPTLHKQRRGTLVGGSYHKRARVADGHRLRGRRLCAQQEHEQHEYIEQRSSSCSHCGALCVGSGRLGVLVGARVIIMRGVFPQVCVASTRW